MNFYVLFVIFWFIFICTYFCFCIFHIDIVYECIVLRCIVKNKLTYLGRITPRWRAEIQRGRDEEGDIGARTKNLEDLE